MRVKSRKYMHFLCEPDCTLVVNFRDSRLLDARQTGCEGAHKNNRIQAVIQFLRSETNGAYGRFVTALQ